MATTFSAAQYNDAFDPRRLGNWQVPKSIDSKFTRPAGFITKSIVDEKGYLLPHIPKRMNAFIGGSGRPAPHRRRRPTYQREALREIWALKGQSELKLPAIR